MGGPFELVFSHQQVFDSLSAARIGAEAWFLDQLKEIPDDLQNYALKPLYSFAGLGVVIAPTKEDIAAIPAEKRAEYILQDACTLSR